MRACSNNWPLKLRIRIIVNNNDDDDDKHDEGDDGDDGDEDYNYDVDDNYNDDNRYNFINMMFRMLLTCSTAPVLECQIVAPKIELSP